MVLLWKNIDGKLVHVTDVSRVKFRTNISKKLLEKLGTIAEENNTHINYLLETGLKETLSLGMITIDKKKRPKDRVQYKTTYDKELLEKLRDFAVRNKIYINDVIEYSAHYISIADSKKQDYKHRIEQEENE